LIQNPPEGTSQEDLALANFVLGFSCEKLDKSSDAMKAYEKSADLLLRCGHEFCAAYVLNNLGSAFVQQGLYAKALVPLHKSVLLATQTPVGTDLVPSHPQCDNTFCVLKSLRVMAECCVRLKRFADASELLDLAVAICRAVPLYSQYGSAVFSVAAVKVLLLERRHMDAARYANFAVDLLLQKHAGACDDLSRSDHGDSEDDRGAALGPDKVSAALCVLLRQALDISISAAAGGQA
jgi:tetratricopeptide (TPR) repeat protein